MLKKRTDQNGATAVEFAIILPVLILILFGIIEFSLLLFNKQIITNATREGARFGIVARAPRYSNQDIRDQIKNYAQDHLITFGSDTLDDNDIVIATPDDGDDTNGACVCSNPNPATDERCLTFGCDLKITVTYNYDFLVLSQFLGQIPLEAVSVMKME
jgi:Flp pilus assembly protein TadG